MLDLRTFLEFAYFNLCSQAKKDKIKEKLFRKIVHHAYHHSKFYKDYYSSHGISEKDIETIGLTDLPFVDKTILMDNLDDVFTFSDLKQKEIESWLQQDHNPKHAYKDKYYCLHTSGSSAKLGIFVYTKKNFETVATLVGGTLFKNKLPGTKLLFYGAIHGHFCGATLHAAAAAKWYNLRMISVLEPLESHVEMINEFQPTKIVAYPSSLLVLAEAAKKELIHINPKEIAVSGEPLTQRDIEIFQKVWNVTPGNVYSGTEGLNIGFQAAPNAPFYIYDNLNLLEIIDDESKPVPAGEAGKSVLTNLFNFATPVIRYRMNDRIIKSIHSDTQLGVNQIESIKGRTMSPLPITTNSGTIDYINPHVINEFFVPGLQNFQFISRKNLVKIIYVSHDNLNDAIFNEFEKILIKKNSSKLTRVEIERVNYIEPDKTGKVALIKIEDSF
jgi:phenylacetate-CoA ligase